MKTLCIIVKLLDPLLSYLFCCTFCPQRKHAPTYPLPPPPLPPKPRISRESLSPTYDCLTPKTTQQPINESTYDTLQKRQITPPPPPESLYDSPAKPPRYLHEAIAAVQRPSEPLPELPPRNPGLKWTSIEEDGHRSSRSRERQSLTEKVSSDSKPKRSSLSSSHSRSRSRERSSSHPTERHSEKSRSSERSKVDSKKPPSSPGVLRKHSTKSKEKESPKKRSPSKEKESPKSRTDSSRSTSKVRPKSEKSPEKSPKWKGSPIYRSESKSSLRSGATAHPKVSPSSQTCQLFDLF